MPLPVDPIRFYTEATPVHFARDNEPLEDIVTDIEYVDGRVDTVVADLTTVQSDLSNHIGQGGVSEHAAATADPGGEGFMTPAQVRKLALIQDEAQVNILSPTDSLELISRDVTFLHLHANALPNSSIGAPDGRAGFLAADDKRKLNGIAENAKDHQFTTTQAGILVGGPSSNADSLHTHPSVKGIAVGGGANPTLTLNFTGSGVSVAGSGSTSTVTITSGGGPAPPAYSFDWQSEKGKFPAYSCLVFYPITDGTFWNNVVSGGAWTNASPSFLWANLSFSQLGQVKPYYSLDGNFIQQDNQGVWTSTIVMIEANITGNTNLRLTGQCDDFVRCYTNNTLQFDTRFGTGVGGDGFYYDKTISISGNTRLSLVFVDTGGHTEFSIHSMPFEQTGITWVSRPTAAP